MCNTVDPTCLFVTPLVPALVSSCPPPRRHFCLPPAPSCPPLRSYASACPSAFSCLLPRRHFCPLPYSPRAPSTDRLDHLEFVLVLHLPVGEAYLGLLGSVLVIYLAVGAIHRSYLFYYFLGVLQVFSYFAWYASEAMSRADSPLFSVCFRSMRRNAFSVVSFKSSHCTFSAFFRFSLVVFFRPSWRSNFSVVFFESSCFIYPLISQRRFHCFMKSEDHVHFINKVRFWHSQTA